ncbi:MAG: hypothetical protein AVDCRST_MAG66-333, partial [uncultured Pseudonocardia sp.]
MTIAGSAVAPAGAETGPPGGP